MHILVTYIGSKIHEDHNGQIPQEGMDRVGCLDKRLIIDERVGNDRIDDSIDGVEEHLEGDIRGVVGGAGVDTGCVFSLEELAVIEETRLRGEGQQT